MNNMNTTITILGGLGLFLYGMKVMSESLQMATGDRLRSILGKITHNRIAGVLTGVSITSIIQSSSATTVMLVSFVNAGLLTLQQSIGVILGANIGTTLTGWIVAFFGFKIKIMSFALPAIAIGFALRFVKSEKLEYWGEVLLGFGILFLGLNFMSSAVQDLRNSTIVMDYMSLYRADTLFSTIVVVIIGAAVTMIVQSSSATMAMTMTLAVNGLIDFPTSCALILGENIGTTITANIAAMGTSISAKRTAFAHFLFNIFGVIWVLAIFRLLLIPLVDFIIPGNLNQTNTIADHMAAFHSIFNIVNMILFLPFIHTISWLTIKLLPGKIEEREKLKYISTMLLSTPPININQARLEIKRMAETIIDMFDMVMNIFKNPASKLGDIVEDVQIKENLVDILEKEISTFLVKVSQHNISEDQSHDISTMLHIVNELERIGDHCESLLKLIRRKYDSKFEFSETAIQDIEEISGKVREFLELLYQNITAAPSDILPKANVIENRIDELRTEAKKRHINRLNEGADDVSCGLIFMDMLTSFEKIGDHSYNVAEGISGIRFF